MLIVLRKAIFTKSVFPSPSKLQNTSRLSQGWTTEQDASRFGPASEGNKEEENLK